jgi:hypothetical protein
MRRLGAEIFFVLCVLLLTSFVCLQILLLAPLFIPFMAKQLLALQFFGLSGHLQNS